MLIVSIPFICNEGNRAGPYLKGVGGFETFCQSLVKEDKINTLMLNYINFNFVSIPSIELMFLLHIVSFCRNSFNRIGLFSMAVWTFKKIWKVFLLCTDWCIQRVKMIQNKIFKCFHWKSMFSFHKQWPLWLDFSCFETSPPLYNSIHSETHPTVR